MTVGAGRPQQISLSGGSSSDCGFHLFQDQDAELVAAAVGFMDQYNAALDPGPAATALAVEFYNAALDHYFLTHIAGEIATLDAGVTIRGWKRTGQSFNVYPSAVAGASPVCRFYIPPDKGDSHFYGRGTAECDATAAANPSFTNEDAQFFHVDVSLPQRYFYDRQLFPLAFFEAEVTKGDRILAIQSLESPWDTDYVLPPLTIMELSPESDSPNPNHGGGGRLIVHIDGEERVLEGDNADVVRRQRVEDAVTTHKLEAAGRIDGTVDAEHLLLGFADGDDDNISFPEIGVGSVHRVLLHA